MPELPEQIVQRLVSEYCIVEDVALVVASHPGAMHLYEETVKAAVNDLGNGDLSDKEFDFKDVAKTSANWLCNDLLALLKGSASSGRANAEDMSSDESTPFTNVTYSSVDGTRLGLLVAMVMADIVSTRSAKQILSVMFKEELEMSPREIADQRGWKLITDEAKLRQLCLNVVLDKNNQSQLMQYQRGGKRVHKMEKFFLGKVMWSCDGNAEPDLLREMLQKVLEEQSP